MKGGRYFYPASIPLKVSQSFKESPAQGHSAVPWKTIDILNDWAVNSKSQTSQPGNKEPNSYKIRERKAAAENFI